MADTRPPTITPEEATFDRRLAAVTEAVDKYHSYLLNYLYRMTAQWQDAENLAQELWRIVLLNFDEDKIGSLPLLRRKAYQLFVDHYRRLVRRGEIISDEVPEVAVSGSAPCYTDADENTFRAKFWSDYPGINLSDQQKEALWLHARYGFTYKEIEVRLCIPSSTVGDWILLARKRLAEALNAQII